MAYVDYTYSEHRGTLADRGLIPTEPGRIVMPSEWLAQLKISLYWDNEDRAVVYLDRHTLDRYQRKEAKGPCIVCYKRTSAVLCQNCLTQVRAIQTYTCKNCAKRFKGTTETGYCGKRCQKDYLAWERRCKEKEEREARELTCPCCGQESDPD